VTPCDRSDHISRRTDSAIVADRRHAIADCLGGIAQRCGVSHRRAVYRHLVCNRAAAAQALARMSRSPSAYQDRQVTPKSMHDVTGQNAHVDRYLETPAARQRLVKQFRSVEQKIADASDDKDIWREILRM
jgi:hypothetical protein